MTPRALFYRRLLALSLFMTYTLLLIDVYYRYNGINFWVMILVFTPLHILFTIAPNYYTRLKWLLSGFSLLALLIMILSFINERYQSWFDDSAAVYMLFTGLSLLLAGASLLASENEE